MRPHSLSPHWEQLPLIKKGANVDTGPNGVGIYGRLYGWCGVVCCVVQWVYSRPNGSVMRLVDSEEACSEGPGDGWFSRAIQLHWSWINDLLLQR